MNICPYCGAALIPGESHCPRCRNPLRMTIEKSVTLSLSRKEARRGCTRSLRYPGAPRPIRVSLPAKLCDGAELCVENVSFLTSEGDAVKGRLYLKIRVKKSKVLPLLAGLVLLAAMVSGVLLLKDSPLFQSGPMGSLFARPSPTPEPTAVPVETPVPTPEPTPYVSPLRPLQQEAAQLIPNFELRYFLMELDDRLLENFCALYTAVRDFEAECSFPEYLNRDELSNLMLLLSYECPELLQFSSATEMNYLVDEDGTVLSVVLDLCLTPEEYSLQYQQCARVVREFAIQSAALTEYEKELAAYEYLAGNCFYDFESKWSASAYGALVEGHAKCDGISLAMKWLCEEMGISCMVIAGKHPEQEIGHAWNVVCIDGTYYDLDVTNDVNSAERSMRYYGALNVSRHWIRDKYPDRMSFAGFLILPGSESMGMSYHVLNGSYVARGADAESILFSQLDAMTDAEPVYVQFESAAEYQAFIHNINDIMSRWDGLSRGSFNFSLSHLDEFQVCCVTVNFI